MRKKEMTNGQIVSLYQLVKPLIKLSNIPLKFTISNNIKMLKDLVAKDDTVRNQYFLAAVKIDQAGDPILKAEHQNKELEFTPYEYYEYNSPESFIKLLDQLSTQVNIKHQVEFYTEPKNRKIRISMINEEGKTVYIDSTIEDILEDPNNSISSGIVMALTEYMLD